MDCPYCSAPMIDYIGKAGYRGWVCFNSHTKDQLDAKPSNKPLLRVRQETLT